VLVAGLLVAAIPTATQAAIYLPTVRRDPPCRHVTEIPQSECQVLVSVFDHTDGPNWLSRGGWLTDNHPCNWLGVYCANGHIEQLTFIRGFSREGCLGNGLNGVLPPEIGNLSHLTSLSSCSNSFTTSIPPEWGMLSNLERLEFIGNQLTGPIPPEFGNLSKLQSINLNSNDLSGSLPAELGNLAELEELSLIGNQLSGPVPQEIGNLAQLKRLDLGSNRPDLCMPSSLDSFTQSLEYYGPPDGGTC
jgi:hypothetical protein